MCGGVRSIAAREDDDVSPVRTADVIAGAPIPSSVAIARMPSSGSARFLWMSLLSAFSGET